MTALLVDACRRKRARREQLVVLNWAVRSRVGATGVARFMAGEGDARDVGVRYEPALVRAVNIAVGVGLLASATNDWIELSASGRVLIERISEAGIYAHERAALAALPMPLPFVTAEQLLRGQR